MKCAALIPYYKCAQHIETVVRKIDFLEKNDFIVILDDGSYDGLERIKFLDHRVKIFQNPVNLGYGGTSQRLYAIAKELSIDYSINIHGDGGHCPEEAAHVLQQCISGYDICIGTRLVKIMENLNIKGYLPIFKAKNNLGMPLSRLLGHLALTSLQNFCYNTKFYSFHEGMRACNKKVINWINTEKLPTWYNYDEQLLVALHKQKFRINEVPISPNYSVHSSSSAPRLKYGVTVAWKAIQHKISKREK